MGKISRLLDRKSKYEHMVDLAFAYQTGQWKNDYERCLDAYKGKYHDYPAEADRYVANIIFSLMNLVIPNLVFNQPYIKVKAKNPVYVNSNGERIDAIQSAEVMETALNEAVKRVGMYNQINMAIFDATMSGIGVTKTGYDSTLEPFDAEFDQTDEGFSMRISPYDFGFHPMATNENDAVFLTHRVFFPMDQARKDDRFKNRDSMKGSIPDHIRKRLEGMDVGAIETLEEDFVEFNEIHLQMKNKLVTLGGGKEVRIIDNPYWFKGSHFSILRLAPIPDDMIGNSLMNMVIDQAEMINTTLTYMINHVKSFPGRVFVEEALCDEAFIDRLREPLQGGITIVPNGALSNGKMQFSNPVPMGQDYQALLTTLFNVIDRVLGIPDFLFLQQTKRKTATEANIQQSDASIRREYLRRQVKDFILENVRKFASLMQQYYTNERYIKLAGKGHVTYTNMDIQGDFIFDFDIDEIRFISDAQVQGLVQSLTLIASQPALQPILGTLDPEKMAQMLFKWMGISVETIQLKNPPPVPPMGQAPAAPASTPPQEASPNIMRGPA